MNDQPDFYSPRRQSMIGVVVYFLRHGRLLASLVIALIAVGSKDAQLFGWLTGGMLLFIVIVAGFSYLQYLNFTFHLENDELVIHRGVLVKDKKNIPLSRIQSVQIEQNIIQQALGVVGLKIDSAGSTEKELEIAALREPVAREFRDLLKRKPGVQPDVQDTAAIPVEETEEVLVSLAPADLLKVGLTENHVRNGLVAVLVVYGYATQYMEFAEEYFYDQFGEYIEDVPGQVLRAGLALILAGIITFLVISVIISLGRTILKFFNYKASIQGDVVEISSGLLKKNEYRIPVHKIQFLKWESNPLRRILGFRTVKVFQVEPGKQRRKKMRVEIPACYPEQARALEKLVYDDEVPVGEEIKADKWAYTRFYSVIFSLPVIILIIVLYLTGYFFWYLPAGILPLIVFLAYMYGNSVYVTFLSDLIIIRKGWIFPSRTVISYYKIQASRFADNVFVRPRGLAHLILHTASGSIRVRYLPTAVVSYACAYAISQVQQSRRSWM